ncbi:hypothetical protein FB451DRAFT_1273939 [Mycena latifolia]|nr:hypothetical protein FB451DRAFT_1273939 [Mycena latifolia]
MSHSEMLANLSLANACQNCGFRKQRNSTLAPPPSSSSTPQWRALQRARLAETTAKIRDYRVDLERLEAEREELEGILETFIFPVLSIPAEVMGHIFEDCLPANGRVQPSERGAPLVLAQICRHWRDIALSNPHLWSSVDMTFRRGSSSDYGACALIKTWFRRTKGQPLSITLRCETGRGAMMPLHLLPTISEFSQQWGRLEIAALSSDISTLDLVRGPFPVLHTLAVDSVMRSASSRLTAFEHTPRLRELRLLSNFGLDSMRITSTSITTLELAGHLSKLSIRDLIAIFRRFPHLLHFSAPFEADLLASAPGLNDIPPLESLITSYGDPLPVFSLPHLRRLQCTPRSTESFLSFLSRSACVLQHFALIAGGMDDMRLLECLRAVPSLVSLDIRGREMTHSLYGAFQSSTLLPQLRQLTVFQMGHKFSFDPVIAMLRARSEPHPTRARLSSFDLRLDVGYDGPDDERWTPRGAEALQLQDLVAAGLSFRVHINSFKRPAAYCDDERFPAVELRHAGLGLECSNR